MHLVLFASKLAFASARHPDANLQMMPIMNPILDSRAYLGAPSTRDAVHQIEEALGGTFAQREYANSIAGHSVLKSSAWTGWACLTQETWQLFSH
jgi:hypothetical protein